MTTQPSIESLRDDLHTITYPQETVPHTWTPFGLGKIANISAALTELERLRAGAVEAEGLRVAAAGAKADRVAAGAIRESLEGELDALRAELAAERANWESCAEALDTIFGDRRQWMHGSKEDYEKPDPEICPICAKDGAWAYAELQEELAAETKRREEAEAHRDALLRNALSESEAYGNGRKDAQSEYKTMHEDPSKAVLYIMDLEQKLKDFRAESSLAFSEAARVPVLLSRADAAEARNEALTHYTGHHLQCTIRSNVKCDCGLLQTLSSTPAAADLSARDARIRREALEAAAKKCATAYWEMVAPRDHAAMHPTIEFWREALDLPAMTPAEHEAQALREPRHPEIVLVDDLAMLVRLLVHSLRKHSPDNETARKAVDYLRRHELQGSPLRTTILSPAPDAASVQPSASPLPERNTQRPQAGLEEDGDE